MDKLSLVGIRIDERDAHAPDVQKVLTNYGSKISGRFGIPASDKHDGLIAIVMVANDNDVQQFTSDLRKIQGVAVNFMNM